MCDRSAIFKTSKSLKKFTSNKKQKFNLISRFRIWNIVSQIRNVEIVCWFENFVFERFEILQYIDDVISICITVKWVFYRCLIEIESYWINCSDDFLIFRFCFAFFIAFFFVFFKFFMIDKIFSLIERKYFSRTKKNRKWSSWNWFEIFLSSSFKRW